MRILIVEDEVEIRNCLKASLESEDFVVDAVDDGKKGSFTARTNEYDLVILDINLPEKDGLTICKEIRAEDNPVPILMLSVNADASTKANLINAGADDYLTKPFSFEELLARVNALLRRPRQLEHKILKFGDLEIDSASDEVSVAGSAISLTKKEYMLLELLAQRAGTIVSRGTILEHVWDMNADPFSNTIETHIRNIRKKISERCPDRNFIRTISGRGYMFEKQPKA